MNILKKITGRILYAVARLISKVLDGLISIIEIFVTAVKGIAKGFWGLIGMGGCFLLLFAGPFIVALLMNPITLFFIMFLILFPILGTKFVSYIKYLKYMITEFLFDHANYLMHGNSKQFQSFSEYGDRYKRAEDAKKRKEQEQRQYQQQKEWEERFRKWYEYQNSQRGNSGQYTYGWHGQDHDYANQHLYADPTVDFKNKFEESCDLLGIGYNADKYQVKLAYRKKAKEYHPDINGSPGATKLFQQINNAYEFLSDDSIERYKNIKKVL
jgi:DnaJ-domain-containing protein 1